MTLLRKVENRVGRCRWCGRRFTAPSGPGRPRLYCRRSCRQRDYETRRRAAALGLGEHELIVARAELHDLQDRRFELASIIQDIEADLAAGIDDHERLLNDLLTATKQYTS